MFAWAFWGQWLRSRPTRRFVMGDVVWDPNAMRRAKVTIVEGAGRPDEAAYGLVYDDASTGIGFGNSLELWTPERDLELRRGLTRFKAGTLEASLRATINAERSRGNTPK
jgi:hypothetical protein